MTPIRWLFFDVGDVLFDEDTQHLYLFHSILLAMRRAHVDVTWDDYYERIRDCTILKPDGAADDAGRHFVPDPIQWKEIYHAGRAEYLEARKPRPYGLLLDGILPVVTELSESFSVGVIANQHPQVVQGLNDYGVGRFCKVIVIDEIVGVGKPDPGIFRYAFDQAGCAPEEAIMIGDRCDNDVLPAKRLGMRTVRFQRGLLYSRYEPKCDEERADCTVQTVDHLATAIRSTADLPL